MADPQNTELSPIITSFWLFRLGHFLSVTTFFLTLISVSGYMLALPKDGMKTGRVGRKSEPEEHLFWLLAKLLADKKVFNRIIFGGLGGQSSSSSRIILSFPCLVTTGRSWHGLECGLF